MFKKNIIPEDIVELLNEMLKLDYEGTKKFVEAKIEVNEKIANHETIQVNGYTTPREYLLGIIGFLNGLFGVNENHFGCICCEIKGNKIIEFKVDYNLKNKE